MMSTPRGQDEGFPSVPGRRRVSVDWSTLPTLTSAGPEEEISEAKDVHCKVSYHPEAIMSSDGTGRTNKHGTKFSPWQTNNTQIPMAMVTPFPGMNAIQQESYDSHESHLSSGSVNYESDTYTLSEKGSTVRRSNPKDCGGTVGVIEKWKGLIDMKDAILRQKNLQIERQKATITKMQQDIWEMEEKLKCQIVSDVFNCNTSALEARLQSLEAENSSIKAQLAEALSSQNGELGILSKRLDHKEYELHKAAIAHEESRGRSQQIISSLQKQVTEQECSIRHFQQKVTRSDAVIQQHLGHIDQLKSYMGHMPSMEEHEAVKHQNGDMQIECDELKKKLSKMDITLKQARQTIEEKTLRILSQDSILKDLENTRERFHKQKENAALFEVKNKELNEKCQHLQKMVLDSERRCRQELQAMRERHRSRFVEATAKLRSQYKSLAKRSRALELQLTRNSDTMIALNGELQSSQGTIGELKTSVKELVSQNQDLLEKNLHLQESTAEAIKATSQLSETKISSAKQLCYELSLCTDELDSTISLSLALLKGQEPNASLLFGSDGIGTEIDGEDVGDDLETSIARVKCIRHKVEELRSIVSEHFASKLSTACNIQ